MPGIYLHCLGAPQPRTGALPSDQGRACSPRAVRKCHLHGATSGNSDGALCTTAADSLGPVKIHLFERSLPQIQEAVPAVVSGGAEAYANNLNLVKGKLVAALSGGFASSIMQIAICISEASCEAADVHQP